MYYCADCCDNHDHKSVVISKKVREFGTDWKKLIEEIANVAGKASQRFSQYKSLIDYCDEVNNQLPSSEKVQG